MGGNVQKAKAGERPIPSGHQALCVHDGRSFHCQLVKITPASGLDLAIFTPAIIAAIVSIAGIIAVHKLTRYRENEKLVKDFVARFEGHVDDLAEAAKTAWKSKKGNDRIAALVEFRWHINRIGTAATTLKSISERGLLHKFAIDCTIACKNFKDGLTQAHFSNAKQEEIDDQERASKHDKDAEVERLKGHFLSEIEQCWGAWLRQMR